MASSLFAKMFSCDPGIQFAVVIALKSAAFPRGSYDFRVLTLHFNQISGFYRFRLKSGHSNF